MAGGAVAGGMGGAGGAGGGAAAGGSTAGGVATAGGTAGGRAGGSAGGAVAGGSAGGSVAGGGSAAGGSAGGSVAGGSAGGAAACSSVTCATGCCLNGTCQPGTQPLACGTNGSACVQCPTNTMCTNQACGPNLTRRFKVRVISAAIDSTKLDGRGWDSSSGPDAFTDLYCDVSRLSPTDSTEALTDAFSPSWTMGECVMTLADLTSRGFAYQMFDEDWVDHDEIAPTTTVTPTAAQVMSGSMTAGRSGACRMVSFSFTPM